MLHARIVLYVRVELLVPKTNVCKKLTIHWNTIAGEGNKRGHAILSRYRCASLSRDRLSGWRLRPGRLSKIFVTVRTLLASAVFSQRVKFVARIGKR